MSNYTIIVEDNTLIKDGVATRVAPSTVQTFMSPYSVMFQHPVGVIQYYGDRDQFEVEYTHHPLDLKPNNTVLLGEELSGFITELDTIFTDNYVVPDPPED